MNLNWRLTGYHYYIIFAKLNKLDMTNKFLELNLTKSEEDYLKALFSLIVECEIPGVGTNHLASHLGFTPASVHSMVKKLRNKQLVTNEKYGKLKLTKEGETYAIWLIRKHRLWETFLYNFLNFSWEEVHEVAEQLEHIRSPKLIRELDRFMNYPNKDPHGDHIPDRFGAFDSAPKATLSSLQVGMRCRLVAVKDSSVTFLKHVTELGLMLSSEIEIIHIYDFDLSLKIQFNNTTQSVSRRFAEHLFVEPIHS